MLSLTAGCNFIEAVTGSKANIDEAFQNRSDSNTDLELTDEIFGFWRFEESISSNQPFVGQVFSKQLTDLETMAGGMGRVSGQHAQGISCQNATGIGGTNQMVKSVDTLSKSSLSSFSFSIWVQKGTTCTSSFDNSIFSTRGLEVVTRSPVSCSNATVDTLSVISRQDSVDVSDSISVKTTISSQNSNWHHLVVSFQRSNPNWSINVYIDGALVLSDVVTQYATSDTYISLCERYNSYGYPTNPALDRFRGNLDSFGLWNRLLTTQEIQDLYSGNNSLDI